MNNFKSLGLIFAAAALSACGKEVVDGSYVNKADASQTLKLIRQQSLRAALVGRIHGGQDSGVYTLKTDRGTKSGRYSYVSESGTSKYIFKSADGERWEGKIDSNGSFTGEGGVTWKPQPHKLSKSLKRIGG